MDTNIKQAADYLSEKVGVAFPKVAVVAGSGLGGFTNELKVELEIPYGEIPGFEKSAVEGHRGAFMLAKYGDTPLAVLSGRIHLYEGHSAQTAVTAVRVMGALGAKILIVSNAAGGLNRNFFPGDLMLIRDQINNMFRNPLIGPNDPDSGPRFPDMSEPYDRELGAIALDVAREEQIILREGVYLAGLGPTYETRAEVDMLRFMGADVVGMSTVIETIAAIHAGMRVLGITLVSNSHVQEIAPVTTHEEVMEMAEQVAEKFARLVGGVIRRIEAS